MRDMKENVIEENNEECSERKRHERVIARARYAEWMQYTSWLRMVKCPKCDTEVANTIKTWFMTGKLSKAGERVKLTMGLHECPNCKARFRVVVGKEKIKA
jgi:hypothetical protein